MKFTTPGTTGLKVSRICRGPTTYGSSKWRDWVMDEEAAKPFYAKAFEAGINFFDTADMYSLGASEEGLGGAVRGHARRVGRGLATKGNFPVSDAPNDPGAARKQHPSPIAPPPPPP